FVQRFDVVVGDHAEARNQRLEPYVVFFLAGRAQRAEGAAVERTERGNDLEAAGAAVVAPAPRQLKRGLVGFRARVAKEQPPVAKMPAQPRGQPRHRFGVKDVGDVSELFGLLLDRAHDARMAVAERRHGEAAEKIQIAVAIGVIEISAGAAHEGERHAAVSVDEILMGEVDDFSVVHRFFSWILSASWRPSRARSRERTYTTRPPKLYAT